MLLPILLTSINTLQQVLLIFWIGLSDFLDGYLARKWQQTSRIGAIMDQWADKIATIALLFFFLFRQQLALFFVILFIVREIGILITRQFKIATNNSTFISKLKTFTTYSLLILLALNNYFHIALPIPFEKGVFYMEIFILYLALMGLIMGFIPIVLHQIIRFFATSFYTSLIIKKAPGTIASIFFFICCYLLRDLAILDKIFLLGIILMTHYLVYPLYINNAHKEEEDKKEDYKEEDPAEYTLDELAAIAFIFCFLPFHVITWILAFVLFRFFDIVKPLGIRRFEKHPRVAAVNRVLGDDMIAAVYTLILLAIFNYVIS